MAGTAPGHFDTLPHRKRQTPDEIHCCSFCFGAAPPWREAICPSLNIIKVGIDMMPYCAATFGFSSTLSLTILTLSPSWPAISSRAGAIMRHGPHHSAQKSTTTGSLAFSTSASKLASDTLPTAMELPRLVCEGAELAPRKEGAPNVWRAPASVKAGSRGLDLHERGGEIGG